MEQQHSLTDVEIDEVEDVVVAPTELVADTNGHTVEPQQQIDVRTTENAIIELDRQLELQRRYLLTCIKHTNPGMWEIFGDSVRIKASAVKALRLPLQMKIELNRDENGEPRFSETHWEDEKGGAYAFELWGQVTLGDHQPIDVMGRCSSRNRFYSKGGGEQKPLSEVDRQTVKLHCYANFLVHCFEACGFGYLTKADLAEAWQGTNRSLDSVHVVQFKSGGEAKRQAPQVTDEAVDMRVFIRKSMLEINAGDTGMARTLLEEISRYTRKDGSEKVASTVDDLSQGEAGVVFKKTSALMEKFKAGEIADGYAALEMMSRGAK